MISSLFRPKRPRRSTAEEQPFFTHPNARVSLAHVDDEDNDDDDNDDDEEDDHNQCAVSGEDGDDLIEATPLLPIFSAAHLGMCLRHRLCLPPLTQQQT